MLERKNFEMFLKKRIEGHGGVGANLKGKQIKMPDLDLVGTIPVSIFSVYIPNKNNGTAIAELETVFLWMEQLNGKAVVVGDFNVQHQLEHDGVLPWWQG